MDTSLDVTLTPIGFIRSTLHSRREAPCQGSEGAPDVWLDLVPAVAPALLGLEAGAEVIVITWLHQAIRDVRHPGRRYQSGIVCERDVEVTFRWPDNVEATF